MILRHRSNSNNKDNSFTIHQQNIQSLAIEMYKVANGLSTNLFSEIFTKNEATNHFRSKSDFRIPKVRTYHMENVHLHIWAL